MDFPELPIDMWSVISIYVYSPYPMIYLSQEINSELKKKVKSYKLYKEISYHYGISNINNMHCYGLITWTKIKNWSEFSKEDLNSSNILYLIENSKWNINYTRLDNVLVNLTHKSIIENLLRKLVNNFK
tara:strand:- start:1005 stop:1391 length:387 start_codon:yes stop_codon:yes gene_type:complete